MNDPILTQAVVRYNSEKTKISERQRRERDAELLPFLADIGGEINRVRQDKRASIADIGAIMGVQNRTFIYAAIKAAKGKRPTNNNEQQFDVPREGDEGDTPLYTLKWFNNDTTVVVEFDQDESYEIPVIDGTPDLPEEWADHTRERRDLYKQIVKEIRKGV